MNAGSIGFIRTHPTEAICALQPRALGTVTGKLSVNFVVRARVKQVNLPLFGLGIPLKLKHEPEIVACGASPSSPW
jgi:hypothetical protein